MSKNIVIILSLILLDLILNVIIPMTLVWIALNGYLAFELVDYYWFGLGVRMFIQGLETINFKIKGDK